MPITNTEALTRTIEHREIFHDEMLSLMRRIMSGEMSPVMIAALTVGLRVKKETIGEIAAAAQVMREFATKVEVPDNDAPGRHRRHRRRRLAHLQHLDRVDVRRRRRGRARRQARRPPRLDRSPAAPTCWRRSAPNIMLTPAQVAQSIDETGIGFMFAPNHHAAMKHAAPVRKELGVRTIFNILGPLTNPAGAPNQLMGVFHPDLVGIQVRVLQRLGAEHVMVVYGKDGMDEVSLGAATMVGELKDGEVREYEIHPEDFGLHDDVATAALQGRRRGRVEGDAAGGARQRARARRATSSCSTPAPRCTRRTSRRSIADGVERARAAIASARRAPSSSSSSP